MEKVYSVKFMKYCDYNNSRVNDGNPNIDDRKYIDVGKEPFLVRESELEEYRKYGDGFRSIEFVGVIKRSRLNVPRHQSKIELDEDCIIEDSSENTISGTTIEGDCDPTVKAYNPNQLRRNIKL